jgi:hypothetical protein
MAQNRKKKNDNQMDAELQGLEHKLYRIRIDQYVQYDDEGPLPEILVRYMETHNGEFPPFMMLPMGPVDFDMGNNRCVRWPGKGPLPEEVMSFVQEYAVLPRHKSEGRPDEEEEEED